MNLGLSFISLIFGFLVTNVVFGQSSIDPLPTPTPCVVGECALPKVFQDSNLLQASTPFPERYIVVFDEIGCNKSDCQLEKEQVVLKANALAAKYQGKIFYYYYRPLQGFAVKLDSIQKAKQLSNEKGVKYVEEDARGDSGSTIQNISSIGTLNGLWGLDRIDNTKFSIGSSNYINNGKYEYLSLGQNVNVYVVDSGIQATHNDFGGRVLPLFTAKGDNSSNSNLPSGYIPTTGTPNESEIDPFGHGTHVAGIIGGNIYGVAKNAKIFSVRVDTNAKPHKYIASENFFLKADLTAGIQAIMENEAREENLNIPAVVNISLIVTNCSKEVDVAVENMIKANITTIVAAGNNNWDASLNSPSRVTEAITVGASSNSCIMKYKKPNGMIVSNAKCKAVIGTILWKKYKDVFSNGTCFGCVIDIFAPGFGIQSASIDNNSSSRRQSGTSQAAPFVTGVVALLLQNQPQLLPNQIEEMIKVQGNAPPLSTDYVIQGGKTNTTRRILFKNPISSAF